MRGRPRALRSAAIRREPALAARSAPRRPRAWRLGHEAASMAATCDRCASARWGQSSSMVPAERSWMSRSRHRSPSRAASRNSRASSRADAAGSSPCHSMPATYGRGTSRSDSNAVGTGLPGAGAGPSRFTCTAKVSSSSVTRRSTGGPSGPVISVETRAPSCRNRTTTSISHRTASRRAGRFAASNRCSSVRRSRSPRRPSIEASRRTSRQASSVGGGAGIPGIVTAASGKSQRPFIRQIRRSVAARNALGPRAARSKGRWWGWR